MRIVRLSVTGLFGRFDHDIPMTSEDAVTIIHGPNGYGKTVILRMLAGLFSGSYAVFREVPFQEFRVELADSSSVSVMHAEAQESSVPYGEDRERSIQLVFKDGANQEVAELPDPSRFNERTIPGSEVTRFFPELEQAGRWEWFDTAANQMLDYDDVLIRYAEMTGEGKTRIPPWMQILRREIPVRLIGTDRLRRREGRRRIRPRHEPESVPAVEVYSGQLRDSIGRELGRFAEESQELDRTFPSRLLLRMREPKSACVSTVMGKLEQVRQRRKRFAELGLFEAGSAEDIGPSEEINSTEARVLELYVEDAESKLSVLDSLAAKIDVLQSIVNDRFLFKRLEVHRDRGFVFRDERDQDAVRPESLSSGEQQQLVVWYQLLFDVDQGTLILLDEPELSLHVAWQVRFLQDLERVAELTGCTAIIATHSPQIIGDRWDLTVELRAPER